MGHLTSSPPTRACGERPWPTGPVRVRWAMLSQDLTRTGKSASARLARLLAVLHPLGLPVAAAGLVAAGRFDLALDRVAVHLAVVGAGDLPVLDLADDLERHLAVLELAVLDLRLLVVPAG